MGKVHSVFKVNGKVGDYVYYTLNGKQVARRTAQKRRGPKTKGEQDRALYNKEFGKASAAGKALREALAEECTKLNDPYLYQRINRLVAQLFLYDPASRGERRVSGGLATAEGQAVLAGFHFHKKPIRFPQILKATRQGSKLCLEFSTFYPFGVDLMEVQVNFDKAVFRKHQHSFAEGPADGSVILKRQFRSRKGFTDLVLVSGEGFLQGVVVTEQC